MMYGSLYLSGSRLYGIHDSTSNYNYVLITEERYVPSIITMCGPDADIIDYRDISIFPIDISYRIRGISNTDMKRCIGIDVDLRYDILVVCKEICVSDTYYVLEDKNLYNMVYTDISTDLREYTMDIITWAKDHNVYGGAYPNGIGYLIYSMNCMRKGYSYDRAIKMIYRRCLYYHDTYRYNHISHVANKSLRYMANMNIVYKYRYSITSYHMDDVLRLARSLIDDTDDLLFIDNDGNIHSSTDIVDSIDRWCMWISDIGIDIAYSVIT